ncbi:hypothetical protein V1477_002892 [Vespula maculifrons]|uniref:Uncharacterized protein n=1 Tax=Vespula maculifrons TaxID=7453 RepID=A0ABD2CV23_VESMC
MFDKIQYWLSKGLMTNDKHDTVVVRSYLNKCHHNIENIQGMFVGAIFTIHVWNSHVEKYT